SASSSTPTNCAGPTRTAAAIGATTPPSSPRHRPSCCSPNRTEDAIIRRFHAALLPLRQDAALSERIAGLGGELVISTPEELRDRMQRDVTQWLDVAERARIPRE
ncbi:MAG: hypothetical protein ACK5PI_08750, partial [Acetobacteraceae bacterium]